MTNTKQKAPKKTAKLPGQRGPGKFNKDMKDCIYRAFHELGGKQYLVDVGKDDPKTFLGLVAKVIPAELQVSGSVLIDLGQQMIEAQQRLDAPTVIDVTPEQPNTLKLKDTSDTE